MPYYRWRGVTLDGSYCKGVHFAHDVVTLDGFLFQQGIALIKYRSVRSIHIFPLGSLQKLLFFEHLCVLISAGVPLRQALLIMSKQTGDGRFADIIYRMSVMIEHGETLHQALAHYPAIFSQQMISTIQIGMQADNLEIALTALCHYLDESERFKKNMLNALLLPVATMLIFFIMVLVILFIIVPRYVDLFISLGKELPIATYLLLQLHAFVTSYYMIGVSLIIIAGFLIIIHICRSPAGKMRIDRWILHIPYVGLLMQKIILVQFLQSLALLLRGSVSLITALEITQNSLHNLFIKAQINQLLDKVRAGQSLSDAMQLLWSDFFSQDLILLVTVGEQTAALAQMIGRAADLYQKQVQQLLYRYTTFIQPLLMIFLGLLIAGLIFAVYTPLFKLAELM